MTPEFQDLASNIIVIKMWKSITVFNREPLGTKAKLVIWALAFSLPNWPCLKKGRRQPCEAFDPPNLPPQPPFDQQWQDCICFQWTSAMSHLLQGGRCAYMLNVHVHKCAYACVRKGECTWRPGNSFGIHSSLFIQWTLYTIAYIYTKIGSFAKPRAQPVGCLPFSALASKQEHLA